MSLFDDMMQEISEKDDLIQKQQKVIEKLNKYSQYKNEFKALNKELQLKDKVIDEMAEMLVKVPDNADNPTTAVAIAMINRNLELKKEQVKRYVINKVKGK